MMLELIHGGEVGWYFLLVLLAVEQKVNLEENY